MKYIISVDTRKTWELNGATLSYAIIKDTREEGNDQWKYVKDSVWFENPSAHKAEKFKTFDFFVFSKKQDSAPLFATTEFSESIRRLFEQAYSAPMCHIEHCKLILPDVKFEKMEFEVLEEIDNKPYERNYMHIYVVREKQFGIKFYYSETWARYDEIIDNREDVCEMRLHPYCSDFKLVERVELEYCDEDM